MTRVARRHEPNLALRDVYAVRYARYLKAVDALRSFF
jgi:hypothetical protein